MGKILDRGGEVKTLFSLIVVLFFNDIAVAEDMNYLCLADDSTGFRNPGGAGDWTQQRYVPLPTKVILKLHDDGGKAHVFGETPPEDDNCSSNPFIYTVDCSVSQGNLIFDKSTLRFVFTKTNAFFGDESVGDIWMTIGRCSLL